MRSTSRGRRPGGALFAGLLAALLLPALAVAEVFSHAVHRERAEQQGRVVACIDCHRAAVDASATRPGSVDHGGCDGAGCHAVAFYGAAAVGGGAAGAGEPDGALCRVCHVEASASSGSHGMRMFPSRVRAERELCSVFSHAAHLAPDRAGVAGCNGCHRKAGGERAPPGHGDCATCHDSDHPLPMSACDGCHVEAASAAGCRPWIPRGASAVPRFAHDVHDRAVAGLRGEPVSCETCHRRVAGAHDTRSIELLDGKATMRQCHDCHDGKTKIPGTQRRVFSTRERCSQCHGATLKLKWSKPPPAGH